MNFPSVTSAFLGLLQGVERTNVNRLQQFRSLSCLPDLACWCDRHEGSVSQRARAWRVPRAICGPLASNTGEAPGSPDRSGTRGQRLQASRLQEHSHRETVPAKTSPLKHIKAIPPCRHLGHESRSISGFSQEEVLLGSRGSLRKNSHPGYF